METNLRRQKLFSEDGNKIRGCHGLPGRVISQCNIRLRLLHLFYDIEVTWRKTITFFLCLIVKKYNFLDCDSFKKLSYFQLIHLPMLSDSSISQSHSNLVVVFFFLSTNTFKVAV